MVSLDNALNSFFCFCFLFFGCFLVFFVLMSATAAEKKKQEQPNPSRWTRIRARFTGGAQDLADATTLAVAKARAVRAIAACERSSETALNLSGLGLRAVPASIVRCKQLQRLDLSRNDLRELPPSLPPSLEILILAQNPRLRDLTRGGARPHPGTSDGCVLAMLPHLSQLDVSDCGLGSLPPSLARCLALKTLSADGNSIGAVPLLVAALPALQRLSLKGNSPVQGLALPLWAVNECVPRMAAWSADVLLVLGAAAAIGAGAAGAGWAPLGVWYAAVLVWTVMAVALGWCVDCVFKKKNL
jgi:hypothetical protein